MERKGGTKREVKDGEIVGIIRQVKAGYIVAIV